MEDPAAMLDAWRERGDHRLDPVRFRFIEALVSRAAAHSGDVRRILDDKVVKLLARYGEDLERTHRADHADGNTASRVAAPPCEPHRGALAELVEHIARSVSSREDGRAASELKTLRYFRSTWSRLSTHRRLTQSLAKLPQNAGPLNSHYLVHQSLTLMRDLSPEYLDRFMSYVDALLWVDQMNGASAPGATPKRHSPAR